jgi:tetratricopeptide (TPR) repeat protein
MYSEINSHEKANISINIQFGYILCNLARIYLYLGKFIQSQNFAERSLQIRRNLPSKIDLAESLNVLGIIFGHKGESDKAIAMYSQSLELRRKIGNKKLSAYSLNNIGENYRLKGEIKKALEFYNECYDICVEIKDVDGVRLGLTGRGSCYIALGELNNALQNYQECISLFTKNTSPFHKIEMLFLTIKLKLSMKLSYEDELTQIEKLSDEFDDKTIIFFDKLTKALILKESPKLRTKLKAQDILEEILNDDTVNMEFTLVAMQSLVELYLIELKISDDKKILKNISDLINEMQYIAKTQNYFPILIKTIILQARFALINNKIENCINILNEAKTLALEKNLEAFLPLIEQEKKLITKEFKKWQKLIDSNASMYERIQESHLIDYLQEIEKIVEDNS